jgi:hypothetical protein
MLPRTIFLSRLYGLFLLLVGLAIATHAQVTSLKITELVHNTQVIFLWGLLTLLAGLAAVLAHNVWSGGAVSILVTLLGWLTLLKGLLLLFLPTTWMMGFVGVGARLIVLYAALAILLGAFLTYSGFRARLR